jgi:hypothetical protein
MGLEKTLSQLMDCPLSTNNTHIIMSTKRTHSIFEVVISTTSLKIQKGYSESVNRRTDNTMANGKHTKMIYKTLHRKLKIEQHEPH